MAHVPKLDRILGHLRKKWKILLLYLAVAGGAIAIEHGDELFSLHDCGRLSLSARFWHQRLATAGYRKPRAHFVRIVSLVPGREPVEPCDARRFLPPLLRKLREARPAMIVVDLVHPSGYCDQPAEPGSQDAASINDTLIKAYDEVGLDVPIVVARPADSLNSLRAKGQNVDELEHRGLTKNVLLLSDNVLQRAQHVQYGIAFCDCDNRRIPLDFAAWPSMGTIRKGETPPGYVSLPYAAAQLIDPEIRKPISYYQERKSDPFTSFIPETAFAPVHARQLCGLGDLHDNWWREWKDCKIQEDWKQALRAKVVVIGSFSEQDVHDSVLGPAPGAVLQANYIESLLDDRHFRPLGAGLEILLTLCTLLVIEGIFFHAESHPHLALFVVGIFLTAIIAVSYVAILQYGYFFTFWIPGMFAGAIRYFDALRAWVKRERGDINEQSATDQGNSPLPAAPGRLRSAAAGQKKS